ncbi:MAG: DUF1801 domain-containing protein [Planctomycetaceae bacterium]|nr:DUF1801 domain-containing protein [Planctomycetaceae bacterium]
MQSKAATVEQYLAELPDDRRAIVEPIRQVFLKNLSGGYEEGMQYGMIGYYVPHTLYPAGYHCDPKQPLPFACIASQKNYLSLYLMCVYDEGELGTWFREAWAKTGKKLDMGKSCVRFKRLDDLPLDVVAEALRRMPAPKWIAHYEASILSRSALRKKTATKKTAPRQAGAKPDRSQPVKKVNRAAKSAKPSRKSR